MNEEREKVYQILELGKHIKNLHHKKGFGGLLFIDLSMIKFSKLSSYIRQLDKENQEYKRLGFKYLQDKNNNLEKQQKEFIEYMNSCIKELEKGSPNKLQNTINLGIIDVTKTILQKYKSIIGENDV